MTFLSVSWFDTDKSISAHVAIFAIFVENFWLYFFQIPKRGRPVHYVLCLIRGTQRHFWKIYQVRITYHRQLQGYVQNG